MPSEPLRKHWIDGALPSFVVQLVLSTVGAVLLGIVLVLVPALVIAAVTKPPGSSLIDRMVDQSLFRVGVDNPYFAGPILAGFILGVLSHRWFRSSSAPWVWLLPAMILAFNVATWKSHIARSNFSDAWANYFTSDCGASECLYEILITAPFYTSVAYTVGWIAKAVARPRGGNRNS